MSSRYKIIAILSVACLIVASKVHSAELNNSKWTITAPGNGEIKAVLDNDVSTVWDSGSPQAPGTAIIIDLKKSVYVYRIFLTCGNEVSRMARSLVISVGKTEDSFQKVATELSVVGENNKWASWRASFKSEANFMISPTLGRYVKIELGSNTSGLSWAIAELSIHGAQKLVPKSDWLEVVLNKNAKPAKSGKRSPWAKTLYVAACDLQYYLMELLDQPVGLCYSDKLSKTNKLKFYLMTPPKEKMPVADPKQADLDDISVVKKGSKVMFSGLTARAVAYGVYEFLYSQGVRWLYPHSYGDSVSARKILDLSVLPLKYSPSFKVRFPLAANSSGAGQPFLPRTKHAERFFLRTGANSFQKRGGPLMGTPPRKNIKGSFHSMKYMFTPKVEKAHPEWWPGPYRLKKGANAMKGGSGLNPCTSSPEVRDYIVKYIENDYESRKKSGKPLFQGYSIMPLDSAVFCECDRCLKLFGKPEKINPKIGNVYWNLNYSDYFFHLVNEVAIKLKKKYPELSVWTCAYAQYVKPPKKIKKLSDNIMVDVCISKAAFDLPLSAPQNQETLKRIQGWLNICSSLGVIEYGLIQVDTTFSVPIRNVRTFSPMVSAISDWHKRQKELGVSAIGGFTLGNHKHMPWAMYAWSRSAWKPDESVSVLLNDFFTGYYGAKAGKNVLEIYKLVENSVIQGGVSQRDPMHNNYSPSHKVFTKKLKAKISPLLAKAVSKAETWYQKERVKQVKNDLEWSFRVAAKGFGNLSYPCYKVSSPPLLDGNLSDPAWAELPVQKGLSIQSADTLFMQEGRWALKRTTQFRIGWDAEYIYLAVECIEPEMAKIEKLGKKARDQLFVIWGQDMKKFRRWPRLFKFRLADKSSNTKKPMCEYKLSKQDDRWILEAKFSQKNLGVSANMPADGVEWLFNMVRYISFYSVEDTWKRFAWSPTYHGGNFSYHLWLNRVVFHGQVLDSKKVARISEKINATYDAFRNRFANHKASLKVFEERFKGKSNLLTKQNKWSFLPRLPLRFFNKSWEPIQLIARSKNPVTMNGMKVIWNNRGQIREWYSVEWWDGKRYNLLYETRNNAFSINVKEFKPVTTKRIRVTIYGDRTGNIDGWPSTLIKNIEAYFCKD